MCGCGCNTCETKPAVLLNESKAPKEILSEGLRYHLEHNRPLTDHLYRAGSTKYFDLFAEARALYARNILEFSGEDLNILVETDLGHFGLYEGKKVPLDFPMLDEEINNRDLDNAVYRLENVYKYLDIEYKETRRGEKYVQINYIPVTSPQSQNPEFVNVRYNNDEDLEIIKNRLDFPIELTEAKYQGKTVQLSSPKRGGSKKFFVYVKDPKTKNIKKVSFGGTTGLNAKINDPKARQNFAKRHNCAEKKDKTKPGYWSCRLPRYAKLLGLKSSFSGFW
jgi:hypothetical protein